MNRYFLAVLVVLCIDRVNAADDGKTSGATCGGFSLLIPSSFFGSKPRIEDLNAQMGLIKKSCDQACMSNPDLKPVPLIKLSCESRNFEEEICSHSEDNCELQTKDASCFYASKEVCKGQATKLLETDLIKFNKHKISYGIQKFHDLAKSTDLQNECCGKDQVCKKGFSEVRLNILTGHGALFDDSTALYGGKEVQFSVSAFADCRSSDCIEAKIYHELGHVCHFWKYHDSKGNSSRSIPTIDQNRKDLEQLFGEDGLKCIEKGLGSSANANSYLQDQYEEVFADGVFFHHWGTAAIASNCLGYANNEHVKPNKFMKCFFKSSSVKNRFCKSTGSRPSKTPRAER